MPEIRQIHDVMREFGVDLTRHRFSEVVQGMVSIVLYDRIVEVLKYGKPIGEPLSPEGQEGLRGSWEAIRSELEAQALLNILHSPHLRSQWQRSVAALRASLDEITTDSVRVKIAGLADHIETTLTQHQRDTDGRQ